MPVSKPSLSRIQVRFPELNITNRQQVDDASDFAIKFSSFSQLVVDFVTAHILSLEQTEKKGPPDGGSGEVSSHSMGPYSMSFVTQARGNREVFLTRTYYGRMALALENRSPKKIISIHNY